MKTVLVLGASGAMGRYVVPELARMGHAVDAVSLDAPEHDVAVQRALPDMCGVSLQ